MPSALSDVSFGLTAPHRARSVWSLFVRGAELTQTSRKDPRVKHTHFSVIAASQAFLSVVIIGTLWRLVALHLMAANNPTANQVGEGMSFQY